MAEAVDSGRVLRSVAARTARRAHAAEASAPGRVTAVIGAATLESDLPERMARLAEAVSREPKNGAREPRSRSRTMRSGLEAFCRGAGIAPDSSCRADAQARLLHLARSPAARDLRGRLKDPERPAGNPQPRIASRARRRIRMIRGPPGPPHGRGSADFVVLAARGAPPGLGAVGARRPVAEAKLHEQAIAQATRAAFIEFLDRLDPART